MLFFLRKKRTNTKVDCSVIPVSGSNFERRRKEGRDKIARIEVNKSKRRLSWENFIWFYRTGGKV